MCTQVAVEVYGLQKVNLGIYGKIGMSNFPDSIPVLTADEDKTIRNAQCRNFHYQYKYFTVVSRTWTEITTYVQIQLGTFAAQFLTPIVVVLKM